MGARKQFQSTAKLRFGRVPTGGYKLYVVGRVRSEPGEFWVVAGSGARRPPLREFETQNKTGYDTKEAALAFGKTLFPSEAKYKEFLGIPLGSDPVEAGPELEDDVVEPWRN